MKSSAVTSDFGILFSSFGRFDFVVTFGKLKHAGKKPGRSLATKPSQQASKKIKEVQYYISREVIAWTGASNIANICFEAFLKILLSRFLGPMSPAISRN